MLKLPRITYDEGLLQVKILFHNFFHIFSNFYFFLDFPGGATAYACPLPSAGAHEVNPPVYKPEQEPEPEQEICKVCRSNNRW